MAGLLCAASEASACFYVEGHWGCPPQHLQASCHAACVHQRHPSACAPLQARFTTTCATQKRLIIPSPSGGTTGWLVGCPAATARARSQVAKELQPQHLHHAPGACSWCSCSCCSLPSHAPHGPHSPTPGNREQGAEAPPHPPPGSARTDVLTTGGGAWLRQGCRG